MRTVDAAAATIPADRTLRWVQCPEDDVEADRPQDGNAKLRLATVESAWVVSARSFAADAGRPPHTLVSELRTHDGKAES